MKLDQTFFASAAGQFSIAGIIVLVAAAVFGWQHRHGQTRPLPTLNPALPTLLPRTFAREGTRLAPKPPLAAPAPTENQVIPSVTTPAVVMKAETPTPPPLPLTVFVAKSTAPAPRIAAPFGRLVPCSTVVALESNHLDTPVIALVSEDVWHDGKLVIPRNTEVHGRADLDRTRERLAATGSWTFVWRTTEADNGTELTVQGLALDREIDPTSGRWGEHDGSAGLRGEVLRTADDRELKLFAATFLATATAALQDVRGSVGLLGETALPAITARNATLAGTGAVLREYAQQIRQAIASDGFYLRVPAGTPFYLYVTQTLDRSQAKNSAAPSST